MLSRWGNFIGAIADSRAQTAVAVSLCVLLFATFELVIHDLLAGSRTALATADAIVVSSTAGLMLWILLTGSRDRRRRVRQELTQIAQLNHEVRNALQILIDSHYQVQEPHREMVFESIARIDAALQRLVPVLGPEISREIPPQLRTGRSGPDYS